MTISNEWAYGIVLLGLVVSVVGLAWSLMDLIPDGEEGFY